MLFIVAEVLRSSYQMTGHLSQLGKSAQVIQV